MIDFVHIGYHKTGTSWLQYYGLWKHPNIILLNYNKNPEARALKVPEVDELLKQLCCVHDFDFKPEFFKQKNLMRLSQNILNPQVLLALAMKSFLAIYLMEITPLVSLVGCSRYLVQRK